MSIPDSYIKDIAISISDDYRFDNSPIQAYKPNMLVNSQPLTLLRYRFDKSLRNKVKEDEKISNAKKASFIGRKEIREKFLHFLRHGSGKGVFMVTGYRGMGKTSFVNTVLTDYTEEYKPVTRWKRFLSYFYRLEHISIINITMAQKQPKDIDILRLMLIKVYEEAQLRSFRSSFKNFMRKAINFLIVLLILPALCFVFMDKVKTFFAPAEVPFQIIGYIGLVLLGIILLFYCLRQLVGNGKTIEILEPIYERCYASSSIVKEQHGDSWLGLALDKILYGAEKGTKSYAAATAKEIEMALISFLDVTRNEYIFVFDELDKMEADVVASPLDEQRELESNADKAFHEQVRERKQAIICTIGSLKNFLTTAKARFIFIAGREMFEATLADIADRQSSLGSMFNYVFYVESFLKEHLKSNMNSLSTSIEAYLMHVLFGTTFNEKGLYKLTRDTLLLRGVTPDVVNKVVILLQNFIIYLTYRSNGSPQKIIKAVHEFIHKEEVTGNNDNTYGRHVKEYVRLNRNSTMFLTFSYNDQYRIGFINYLYRPFLIEYGRSFKKYSDGIVASIPYLFDHLLKFHPFAFSVLHLELIPEVLSVNKVPAVRMHIKNIIDYLSNKHIKETEIGLFEYKFLRRTVNEISMLSKMFESEAAAFNFTLDEGYAIKSYIRNKIRSIEKQEAGNDKKRELFSINYLQTVLGDLYFFDQEYFDAVIAYSDAVKHIEKQDLKDISIRDFLTLTNTRLKLGLSFEHMTSYGEAVAIYTDAIRDVKCFFKMIISKEDKKAESQLILYDLLQVINQCFLANIVIQEKMGIAGGTICSFYTNLKDFFKLSDAIQEYGGMNYMINANILLVATNLLYFRNNDRIIADKNDGRISIKQNDLLTLDDILKGVSDTNICMPGTSTQDMHWSTLNLYMLGLTYIFKGCSISFEINQNKPVVNELLKLTYRRSLWKNVLLKRNDFKYLGIFLSNIGDSLFAVMKTGSDGNYNFLPEQIFDRERTHIACKKIKQYFIDRDSVHGNHKMMRKDETMRKDKVIEFPNTIFLYALNGLNEKHPIATVLKCYYQAAHAFNKRGRKFSTSFQYKKILQVLKVVLKKNTRKEKDQNKDNKEDYQFVKDILYLLEHSIVRPIILMASQNNNHTDGHMINKFRRDLELNHIEDGVNKYLKYNISFHQDIKEADTLFNYIKLQLEVEPQNYRILVNHYVSMGTQYTRILELDLSVKYNFGKLKKINRLIELAERVGVLPDRYGRLCRYRVDIYKSYLYALLSIAKILDIYDSDYIFGYVYHAYVHFRIAMFLVHKDNNVGARKEAIKEVGKLPEMNSSHTIGDAIHHFSMAKQIYQHLLQLHRQGVKYNHIIKEMLYLEDDINDNAYHFGAALERFLMHNGMVRKNIRICDMYIKRMDDDETHDDNVSLLFEKDRS